MDNSSLSSKSAHMSDRTTKPTSRDLKLIGSQLGGCEITDFVGRGGMGSVFKALHKALNRLVAIKILSKGAEDKKAVDWFLREARAIARLEHANIIQVYDLAYDAGLETYFIVMQFVPGDSLDITLKSRKKSRLSIKEALDYGIQTADGLGAAHRMKIVHRDVKPSNLMVTPDGIVKITDFGLAKGLSSEETSVSSGLIVGTPLYMAPEQCVGSDIDGRTDIYALGATLYHLISGSPPFTGENSYEILEKQITASPTRLEEKIREVTPELSDIILRMLAKSPQDRYQLCEDISEDLTTMLHGSSKKAAPMTREEIVQEVTEEEVFRVSGVDRLLLIDTLKQVVDDKMLGTFSFRTRDSQIFLTLGENEIHIFQEGVDMSELQEEYSNYSPLELSSMLLIQTLQWEPFSWEFAEEFPDEEFYNLCLSMATDLPTFLMGYAGIMEVLVNIEKPGSLILSTQIDSVAFLYSLAKTLVVSPVPKSREHGKVLEEEKIASTIEAICSGNFRLEYRSPNTIKTTLDKEEETKAKEFSATKEAREREGGIEREEAEAHSLETNSDSKIEAAPEEARESQEIQETEEEKKAREFQEAQKAKEESEGTIFYSPVEEENENEEEDAISSYYLEALYQVPDFSFFQHLMPDFESVFFSLEEVELSVHNIKALGEHLQQLLKQTLKQSQVLENIGLSKESSILLTGAVLKEKILYSADQLTEIAKVLEQRGDKITSEVVLKELRAIHPHNTKAMEELAALCQELKNYERAAEFWNRVGKLREELQEIDQARSSYEHALELSPSNTTAQLNLFHLHLQNSSPQEIKDIGSSIVAKLRKSRNNDEVIEVCEDILKVAPDTPYAIQELINYHYDLNNLDQVKLLYLDLGQVYVNQGNNTSAVQTYQKLLRIDPDNIEVYGKLSELEGKKGKSKLRLNSAEAIKQQKKEKNLLKIAIIFLISLPFLGLGYHEWSGQKELQRVKQLIVVDYKNNKQALLNLAEGYYPIGKYHEVAFKMYDEQETKIKEKKNAFEKQKLIEAVEDITELYGTNYPKIDYELGELLAKYQNPELIPIIKEKRAEIQLLIKKQQLNENSTLIQNALAIIEKSAAELSPKDLLQAENFLEQAITNDPVGLANDVNAARKKLKDKRQETQSFFLARTKEQEKQLVEAKKLEEENQIDQAIVSYQKIFDILDSSEPGKEALERKEFLEGLIKSAQKFTKDAREHLEKRQYKKAVECLEKITLDLRLSKSKILSGLQMPIIVTTSPDIGLSCTNNGKDIGNSPSLYQYTPGTRLSFGLKEEGFQVVTTDREQTENNTPWKINLQVKRIPIWSFSSKGLIEAPLSLDKDTIYVASRDNSVYAINKQSGEEIWKFYTGRLSEITGTLEVTPKAIYVATLGGYFYSLSKSKQYLEAEERTLWKGRFNKQVFYKGPSFSKTGIVSVGDNQGTVLLLKQNQKDAKLVRRYRTNSEIIAPPLIVGPNLYITNKVQLTSISLRTGKVDWVSEKRTNRSITGFKYSNGKLYITSSPGGLTAYNLKGKKLWQARGDAQITRPPIVSKENAYIIGTDGVLTAVNINSGENLWEHPFPSAFSSEPILYGDLIFATGEDFKVRAFSIVQRKIIWEYTLPEKCLSRPVCDGERLYVCTGKDIISLYIKDLVY